MRTGIRRGIDNALLAAIREGRKAKEMETTNLLGIRDDLSWIAALQMETIIQGPIL